MYRIRFIVCCSLFCLPRACCRHRGRSLIMGKTARLGWHGYMRSPSPSYCWVCPHKTASSKGFLTYVSVGPFAPVFCGGRLWPCRTAAYIFSWLCVWFSRFCGCPASSNTILLNGCFLGFSFGLGGIPAALLSCLWLNQNDKLFYMRRQRKHFLKSY